MKRDMDLNRETASPTIGALMQPVDPAEDITFKVRHPWRWCVRHPIMANATRGTRGEETMSDGEVFHPDSGKSLCACTYALDDGG
jgi:hypothetical protein